MTSKVGSRQNIELCQELSQKNRQKKQVISFNEDEDLEILAYKRDKVKSSLIWIFYAVTLGFLELVFYWYPKWKLVCTHSRCYLDEAEKILLVDIYQKAFRTYTVEDIKLLTVNGESGQQRSKERKNDTQRKLHVHLGGGLEKEFKEVKAIWHRKLCYIWDSEEKKFLALHGYDNGIKHSEYYNFKGFSAEEQKFRRIVYNKNEIEIPAQSVFSLILQEALTPFYIFQVFSLIVWFAEHYYYYTIAIVIMSVVGITSSVIESKKNQTALRKTLHSSDIVTVCRGDGNFEEIQSSLLVPGDLIVIPENGGTLHFDAILLNGNCIVNESILTGESVPITKTPVPNNNKFYNFKEDSAHTLFCGTKIIQTRSRSKVYAVVLRTGFQTTKGQLVRAILYPPPSDFKFDQDSYKFIGVLAVIALVGFVYTIVSKSYRGIAGTDIAVKALDIITIVVPPALPAAMTVGKLYALFRLKKENVYCTNSSDINVSGSLNCICFDKTGTLTEDGLDMFGVVISENGNLQDTIKDIKTIPNNSGMLKGMVSCHSLTVIDGEINGDPLDVKMFESSGWTLFEKDQAQVQNGDPLVHSVAKPPNLHRRVSSISIASMGNKNISLDSPKEIEIIHQFHFSSKLQRMSVIAVETGCEDYVLYCKGAPEKILSLSNPESVPKDTYTKLASYMQQGYRVIALGARKLENVDVSDTSKLIREEMESSLKFLGFIIFENRLKSETKKIIGILKNANLKIVMITGDNILTALSVARECGIIEQSQRIIDINVMHLKETDEYKLEYSLSGFQNLQVPSNSLSKSEDVEKGTIHGNYCFSMSGQTWALVRKYFPQEIPKIVVKGAVFARMTSEQKQQLVQELKMLGYYVGMCGDGANDVGALRAAHVGISLSEEESSVAAPFTSKENNISCVSRVIKEGRAALVTSFGVFKFMVCYSLAEFTSVIILYGVDSNLTSLQFLFIDVFLALQFASTFGKTKAYGGPLSKTPPKSSLLGFTSLVSITLQIVLIAIFQVLAYFSIQRFSWFKAFQFDANNPSYFTCYENYAVYCISMFQYVIIAIVFSKGKPYREALHTNKMFLASILMTTLVCCYITVFPADWVAYEFELMIPPSYGGRVMVLAIALVNFITALIGEDVCVEILLAKKILPRFKGMGRMNKNYLLVERDLDLDPPVFSKNHEAIVQKGICTEKKNEVRGCSNAGFVDES